MAYSIVWPPGLPTNPEKGFSEEGGPRVKRTNMDAGIQKVRRISRAPTTISVSYLMTTAQVAIFEDFVEYTIKGSIRFGWTHPRLGIIKEVRILGEAGKLYNLAYVAPGFYRVKFSLEILP